MAPMVIFGHLLEKGLTYLSIMIGLLSRGVVVLLLLTWKVWESSLGLP